MTETIEWIAVSERMPDAMETVLLHVAYEPHVGSEVLIGFWDGGRWADVEADRLHGVVQAWAEMPKGPQ